MLTYLDSSLALRSILDVPERDRVIDWIDRAQSDGLISSQLLRIEVVRVLRRDGRPLSDAAALFGKVRLVRLTQQVIVSAEAIESHIRTLDALHLATALEIGEPVLIASHDNNMLSVARKLGFETVDPVAVSAG